jgi:hypothetical protein
MPDYLGRIVVPEVVVGGVFPLVPEYPYGLAYAPEVAVHQFGSANAKVEQRCLLGTGARRFTIRKNWLRDAERIALRDFWESKYGPYGAFTYNAANDNGIGTTPYTCRFANEPLAWEMVADWACSVGVTLIEIPTTSSIYPLNTTLTRFPSAALESALLNQTQVLVPLLRVQPLESGHPAIYVSDRRCTVGGQLYQARLLEFDGISQSLGSDSDDAQFTFGNADRVMTALANDVDLNRAEMEFSLFHVGTGIKLDLWKGYLVEWSCDSGAEFRVAASDGLYELTLAYPVRRVSRSCWKLFNSSHCPFSSVGALDLVHFPAASVTSCDKGYDTDNGCLAHGMKRYFGAILGTPQGVNLKDNSTGHWGYGRSPITSVSLIDDGIYDQVIPEIYTDNDMPVNCKILAYRDESEFANALGIVGEGPLGAYSYDWTKHTLDDQICHDRPPMGLRTILGTDPAGAGDYASLGESGNQTKGDWRKAFSGASTWLDNFAAGTALIDIRVKDQVGLQVRKITEHKLQATVFQGLKGWVWAAPGVRSEQVLTNPIWISVNLLLRARGMRNADIALAEQQFDVAAAIAAAAICDQNVTPMVKRTCQVWVPDEEDPGHGEYQEQQLTSETQFKFRGALQEEKPLRDWIQEILMNCLGYYTFPFGKLKLGIRANASVVEAFTIGNILFNSFALRNVKPSFNHLTAIFGSEEMNYSQDSLALYDADHALLIGGPTSPVYLKSQLNLCGTANRSQAARLITARLREELGGATAAEWKNARQVSFRTTVLALNVDPGMVCSLTHPDMPGGVGKFRVASWRLNKDYSIDLEGRTVTESMYDMTTGPRPADVPAAPVPAERVNWVRGFTWHPFAVQPHALDPMYDGGDWTFHLAQSYEQAADGTALAVLRLAGVTPVNAFVPDSLPPEIRGYGTASTGGFIPGGRTYFIAVCGRTSDDKLSPPSNILRVAMPTGTDTNTITPNNLIWPAGDWPRWAVFASDSLTLMCLQQEGDTEEPESIVLTRLADRSTWGVPNTWFRRLRLKAKRMIHSGVIGTDVTAVGADFVTCAACADQDDDWTGRIVSVLGDRSDGSAPLWNFRVTAYDKNTGKFTVDRTPIPGGGAGADDVEVGDVLVIRSQATSYSSTTIGDSGYINKVSKDVNPPSGGLITGAEVGNIVRIIAGTGRGQARRIVGNDTTTLTVDVPWTITPDASSIFVVEAPSWTYSSESSDIQNANPFALVDLTLPFENAARQVMGVLATTVDQDGNESPEDEAPFREIFVFGDTGTVIEVAEVQVAHA